MWVGVIVRLLLRLPHRAVPEDLYYPDCRQQEYFRAVRTESSMNPLHFDELSKQTALQVLRLPEKTVLHLTA